MNKVSAKTRSDRQSHLKTDTNSNFWLVTGDVPLASYIPFAWA